MDEFTPDDNNETEMVDICSEEEDSCDTMPQNPGYCSSSSSSGYFVGNNESELKGKSDVAHSVVH